MARIFPFPSEERTMSTIVDGVDALHELVGQQLG